MGEKKQTVLPIFSKLLKKAVVPTPIRSAPNHPCKASALCPLKTNKYSPGANHLVNRA
jgi:hypothetical protein